MATISIDYESNGDVELILQTHNSAAANLATPKGVSAEFKFGPLSIEVKEVHLRVSSMKLISSSRYFQAMLEGDAFSEGKELKEQGFVEIELLDSEDDPIPMMIILGIIYDKGVQLPEEINLLMLYKVAVLVDKYRWHDLVAPRAVSWYDKISQAQKLPNTFGDDVLMSLWIAWVFGMKDYFKTLSSVAQQDAHNSISVTGEKILIPTRVFCAINEKRENSFKSMEQAIEVFKQKLIDQEDQKEDRNNAVMLCRYMVFGHATFLCQSLQIGQFALPSYAVISFRSLEQRLLNSYPLTGNRVQTTHAISQSWKINGEWDLRAKLLEVVAEMRRGDWGLSYDDFKPSQAERGVRLIK